MKTVKKVMNNTAFPIGVLFAIFLLINAFGASNVFTNSYITGFFKANAPLACVALATGVVIMAGGMDISLGALLSLINVMMTQLVMNGMDFRLAVAVCFAAACACGAFNGLIIGYLRVPPMLATFASMSVFTGLALWIQPSAGGVLPDEFRVLYKMRIFGIPMSALVLLLVLLLSIFIMKSTLGVRMLSVGHNNFKSFVSGIPVYRIQFLSYVIAGMITGIGAIAISASIGGGDPALGDSYSMSAITSCVIGGIALSGGEGNPVGAFLGTLFLALLTTTVVSANVSSYHQDLFKGVIMLAGLILASIINNRRSMAKNTAKAAGEDTL